LFLGLPVSLAAMGIGSGVSLRGFANPSIFTLSDAASSNCRH
jgi:hypothetical protein